MIYVVTGYPRSGTSAMMQALEAGGIPVCVHPTRERSMLARTGSRVLEVTPQQWSRLGFSAEVPEGWAVKIMLDSVHKLAARPTRVIWMRRSAEAIRASVRETWPENVPAIVDRDDWPLWLEQLEQCQRGILEDRMTIEFDELWYDELVSDPVTCLLRLSLPIDVAASAAAIRPELRRHG